MCTLAPHHACLHGVLHHLLLLLLLHGLGLLVVIALTRLLTYGTSQPLIAYMCACA
jgi:hypothetical protein